MAYLARKITRAKWEPGEVFLPDKIPADAVTADLRTRGNTLSFWTMGDPSQEEVRKIALALATAAERIDRMVLVWIEEEAIENRKVEAQRTTGTTPVGSLRDRHVDLIRLDLSKLGEIAGLISGAIRKENLVLFTKKEVRSIIENAVRMNLVALEDLQTKVRDEIDVGLQR